MNELILVNGTANYKQGRTGYLLAPGEDEILAPDIFKVKFTERSNSNGVSQGNPPVEGRRACCLD